MPSRLRTRNFDLLLFIVFPNLEILGFQIVDVGPLLVGDHGVYQHQFGFGVEDRSGVRRRLRANRGVNSRQRE